METDKNAETQQERMQRQKKEGQNIKNIIKSKYNHKYIAALIGISPGHLSQWINGNRRIPNRVFLKLSNVLNFDPFITRPQLLDEYKELKAAVKRCKKRGK